MKKLTSMLLAGALLLGSLSGCADGGKNGRERVTIALWSDQLTEQYGEFLRDSFPDVDFNFYVATNSVDFYRFKNDMGDLPDILTVRRFALRDIADWKESLMDLSDTDIAGTFGQAYLRSYTYEDGTVNWLPTCAEVDSIVINKTMLDENGVSVPANYGEFVSACKALKEKGIRPFASNFGADYTCMEMLQGLSASALTSQEGREWRQKYESGQINTLSEDLWLPVFERFEEFIELAEIGPEDMNISYDEAMNIFGRDEVAMIRGTGDEAERYSTEDREIVIMPFFGETENDNRYLTYPAFQIAASAEAEKDPRRKQLILDIMTAMLSEEGLRKIAANQNMVSYSSQVNIDISPSLENVKSYAEDNRLYIRLASADMFSVSQQVVQGIIRGEYTDARAALDAFNKALESEENKPSAAAHIDKAYSYDFDPEVGSRAASAVMNTVRETVGSDILIAPAAYVAGNILSGDYTLQQLGFLTMGEGVSVLTCNMSGEQVFGYMDYMLKAREKRGSVINDSTLYVLSGAEMTVQKEKDGYSLKSLTAGGAELDKEKTYSVTVIGNFNLMLKDAFDAAGITEYTEFETDYKQIVTNRLAEGGQLAEPSDYITLQ